MAMGRYLRRLWEVTYSLNTPFASTIIPRGSRSCYFVTSPTSLCGPALYYVLLRNKNLKKKKKKMTTVPYSCPCESRKRREISLAWRSFAPLGIKVRFEPTQSRRSYTVGMSRASRQSWTTASCFMSRHVLTNSYADYFHQDPETDCCLSTSSVTTTYCPSNCAPRVRFPQPPPAHWQKSLKTL